MKRNETLHEITTSNSKNNKTKQNNNQKVSNRHANMIGSSLIGRIEMPCHFIDAEKNIILFVISISFCFQYFSINDRTTILWPFRCKTDGIQRTGLTSKIFEFFLFWANGKWSQLQMAHFCLLKNVNRI